MVAVTAVLGRMVDGGDVGTGGAIVAPTGGGSGGRVVPGNTGAVVVVALAPAGEKI